MKIPTPLDLKRRMSIDLDILCELPEGERNDLLKNRNCLMKFTFAPNTRGVLYSVDFIRTDTITDVADLEVTRTSNGMSKMILRTFSFNPLENSEFIISEMQKIYDSIERTSGIITDNSVHVISVEISYKAMFNMVDRPSEHINFIRSYLNTFDSSCNRKFNGFYKK